MNSFRAEVRKLLDAADSTDREDTPAETTTENAYPEQLTEAYYRVRKSWEDAGSQIGAYRFLSNAKNMADKNPEYAVFTEDGVPIYPSDKIKAPHKRVHTVIYGDTLWGIARQYLGDGARYPETKELNGLSSDVIYKGCQLIIPD